MGALLFCVAAPVVALFCADGDAAGEAAGDAAGEACGEAVGSSPTVCNTER